MAADRQEHSSEIRHYVAVIAAAFVLSACSVAPEKSFATPPSKQYASAVRVSAGPKQLECVPYARQLSGINLRGDAWTWWEAARGLYDRGRSPAPGAVLVLTRQRGSSGHLAVVSSVVNDRVILANHANWLNRGRVYENTPIIDVSRKGDWSAVRVWYPPGNTWGKSVYAAYGFIYGKGQVAHSN